MKNRKIKRRLSMGGAIGIWGAAIISLFVAAICAIIIAFIIVIFGRGPKKKY